MLNDCGEPAQSHRNDCSISVVELRNLGRNIHVSDKVLWQMLADFSYIKQARICFDNDTAGQEAAKRIAEKLKSQNIPYEILVPVGKDWNEDLLLRREESA